MKQLKLLNYIRTIPRPFLKSLVLNVFVEAKKKKLHLLLDLFITLFKRHVVSESRNGVFLVLILRLNFYPFQCKFFFVCLNKK